MCVCGYSGLEEHVLLDCLNFMETQLDKPAGKVALEKFYAEKEGLCDNLT